MKAFGRAFLWVAINGAIACLAWNAVVNRHINSGSLFGFLSWANCILTWLIFLVDPEDAREKGRSVPSVISGLYDAGTIALLAWNGWFTLAVVVLLQVIAEVGVYEGKAKEEAK